jgi:hypothetical protein
MNTICPTTGTRRIRISRNRLAIEGQAYAEKFIGLKVVYTDTDGNQHIGTLDRFGFDLIHPSYAGYPIMVTAEGRWARLDYTVVVAR